MPSDGTRRVAVVSGGASGLGQAIAVRLARDGADVVLADRRSCEQTLDAISGAGGRAIAVACDVSDPASVAALADAASDFGACDILVNNAGIYPLCAFDEMSFEAWREVLSVNLDGAFLMARAFTPGMRRRGWGRVINLASHTVGLVASGAAHYVTSKAAIIGFTRALASELGPDGVTVNSVAPGLTRTPGTTRSASTALGDTEALFEETRLRQPIRRSAMPSDIVGAVSFLASEDAAFMTAQTLVVDGGLWRA